LGLKAAWTKKFMRPPISTNSWVWWHAPVIPVTAGSINRIVVQASLSKKDKLSPKQPEQKELEA
jgi:cytochrome c-type biogenesis protein CcmH/NrfF